LQQLILKQRESEHLHHEDDSNSNNCDWWIIFECCIIGCWEHLVGKNLWSAEVLSDLVAVLAGAAEVKADVEDA
jgi:hypothetical protein